MMGSPMFVIVAGGAGVDVVDELYRQRSVKGDEEPAFGLMAIDSNGERLENLPVDIPRIHLTSDDGLASEEAAAYPFFSDDIVIPDADADGQRHIGRYKFDNAALPEYENYYEEMEATLQRIFTNHSTLLSGGSDACSVLLVTSLGGGTGSGTFPLLATIIDRIGQQIDDFDLRILGVGIVPPLDFDPERESPPAELYTYPNTYGALRNLASIFDADEETPLRLPVYSTVDLTTIDKDTDFKEAVDGSGTVFELTESPFDEFLLVSSVQGRDGRVTLLEEMSSAVSTIASAIDAFDRCRGDLTERPDLSMSDDTPSFGTLGYATLRVPHQKVRDYCQRKQERDKLQTRLDQEQSRLQSLCEKRDRLVSALNVDGVEEIDETEDWIDRVRHRLDCVPDDENEFVLEITESEFERVLDELSEEYQVDSYLATLSAFSEALFDETVRQSVVSELEQTYQEIQERYETEVIDDETRRGTDIGDRFEHLERRLSEQRAECQRRLDQAEYGLRDMLPPEHKLLTSRRERLEDRIKQLEADINHLSDARESFESFRSKRSAVERRLAETRSDIHAQLDELESDLTYTRQRRDELQDELSACEADLFSYRQSLSEPGGCGPKFVVPLDRDALTSLTLDECDTDLKSIKAYRDQGLLNIERERLIEFLQHCIDYSRDWPDAITRHDPSKVVAPHRGETYVLYDETNDSLISDLRQLFSVPNELWTASHPDIGFSDCPYRIDVVSVARKGRPDSLLGYQWLAEQAADGVFDAFDTYRDYRRAIAYPEWYDSNVASGFD